MQVQSDRFSGAAGADASALGLRPKPRAFHGAARQDRPDNAPVPAFFRRASAEAGGADGPGVEPPGRTARGRASSECSGMRAFSRASLGARSGCPCGDEAPAGPIEPTGACAAWPLKWDRPCKALGTSRRLRGASRRESDVAAARRESGSASFANVCRIDGEGWEVFKIRHLERQADMG